MTLRSLALFLAPAPRFLAALAALGLLLAGCGDVEDEDDAAPKASAEVLYGLGRDAFDAKNYKEAIENFDEVERQHPYSAWAPRAEIMAAYAHYKDQKFDEARLGFERFVKLRPGHESAPYAYYMMAMCHYRQISDVGRDQSMTQDALAALREVAARFPDSPYARDARLKLDLAEDHLAGKEMMVGRYYLEREEYLAAVNRFRLVVEKYQTTGHAPEALHRLVETYLKLGVREEAVRYGAVLGRNFPESPWYARSYALLEGKGAPEEASWWNGL